MYPRISSPDYGSESAAAVIEKTNAAIDAFEVEIKAIESDGKALLDTACECEPSESAKLFKTVEGLRLRRLKALLSVLQVPRMKEDGFKHIQIAREAAITKANAELAEHEADMNAVADSLDYAAASRERVQFLAQNPKRVALTQALKDARSSGVKLCLTADDALATDEIKAQVKAMLR